MRAAIAAIAAGRHGLATRRVDQGDGSGGALLGKGEAHAAFAVADRSFDTDQKPGGIFVKQEQKRSQDVRC